MSFKLVAQAFDIKVGNPLRKMVLIKLADQANDDGVCWPSYESIARSCEISRRSVVTHIQWLEDNNFLRIERRYNAAESKNYSNRYYLTLSNGKPFKKEKSCSGANAALGKKAIDGANDALGDANDALGDATPALSNGATPAPKPIIKPINETVNEPAIDFEIFWDTYAKKVDTAKCKAKWSKLSLSEQEAVMKHIPLYVASTPDKKFRKNPLTYLNGQCWLDEITTSQRNGSNLVAPANAPQIDITKRFAHLKG